MRLTGLARHEESLWEGLAETPGTMRHDYDDMNGGTNLPDAIYVWNALTIFDNADSSGSTNVNYPNFSTPLPALDALGGR